MATTSPPPAYTKRPPSRSIPKPRHSNSSLARILPLVLVPLSLILVLIFPLLAFLSLIPILGFLALPSLLFSSLFLLYSTAWIPYLLLAQDDVPQGERVPFLPFSPFRCLAVDRVVVEKIRGALRENMGTLFLDWCYRRVMVMGGKHAREVVKENIRYGATSRHVLDVYMPEKVRRGRDGEEVEVDAGKSPVIYFLPGGGWMFGNKRYYTQLALTLRRQGWVIVIPNITKFPQGRCPSMVSDIRLSLSWVSRHISTYGGDPARIHVMGHGSGAHLLLLTIVQDAVVRSRDDYWLRAAGQGQAQGQGRPGAGAGAGVGAAGEGSTMDEAEARISAGIRRLEIWGETEAPHLPHIQGMILMAGISDVIKQIRYEAKLSIEHLSPLRRALGPTHALSLMSSPSHLIYGAKQLIDPRRLPPKVLIVHGGKDTDVPIVQSVLLKTLLVGVGAGNVRLRAYRHLGHLETVTALMRHPSRSRYGTLLLSELRSFLSQPHTPSYYPNPESSIGGFAGVVGKGRVGLPVPSLDPGAVDSTDEGDIKEETETEGEGGMGLEEGEEF